MRKYLPGLVLGFILAVAVAAYAANPPSSDDAIKRGNTDSATSAPTWFQSAALQGWTGTAWTPVIVSAAGQIAIAGGCTAPGATASVTVDTTAGGVSVPATAVTNQVSACAFNASTSVTVYCQPNNSTATTANGWPIEPSTWRCFPTTTVMKCISGSTADVRAYGCAR